MQDVSTRGPRYRAFISYSHRDAAFGQRLHRRLEAYRLPRALVGRASPTGPVPRRLSPIFRDREELPADQDLTEQVRSALDRSDALVVVCSPDAAASAWVAREIDLFRQLNPGRPVLAALVAGEPDEAFPPALRLDADGRPVEPLAADFRSAADGRRLALLKLVAGIVGVRLDELAQRDAQQQIARVTTVTVGALATTLAMGLLTVFALESRNEALRERAESEGLTEFMRTDLSPKLREVGRLEIMASVNARALKYYDDQGLSRLGPTSLARRARLLHAQGEVEELLGRLPAAQARFVEAERWTRKLLAGDPNNPERLFDHAQSQFWLAAIDRDFGRFDAAEARLRAYLALARRLTAIDARDPRYVREVAYAEGGLCTLALRPPHTRDRAMRALPVCQAALANMEKVKALKGPGPDFVLDIANRHGWLADAYRDSKDPIRAQEHRDRQESLIESLMPSDGKNMILKQRWVEAQLGQAALAIDARRFAAARARLLRAKRFTEAMTAYDPTNELWRAYDRKIDAALAYVSRQSAAVH